MLYSMTESEPPPPPAPPPPDDGFPPSLFSSLLEDEEEAAEDMGWGGGDHHHVNWKQRYYQLNVSLARFRMETAELQRSLQEKVSLFLSLTERGGTIFYLVLYKYNNKV